MRISDWSSDVCSSDLREFTVLSQTDLQTPEQFNNIVLRESQGYLVRLRDVGKAEIAAEDERRVTRFNEKTSIILCIIKQATANPHDVSRAVRAEMPHLLDSLTAGMSVAMGPAKSTDIMETLDQV